MKLYFLILSHAIIKLYTQCIYAPSRSNDSNDIWEFWATNPVHPNKVSLRLESFFSIFQAPGGVKEMPLKPAKVKRRSWVKETC